MVVEEKVATGLAAELGARAATGMEQARAVEVATEVQREMVVLGASEATREARVAREVTAECKEGVAGAEARVGQTPDLVAQADMATVRASLEAQEELVVRVLRVVSAGQVATVTTEPMAAPVAPAVQAPGGSILKVGQVGRAGMRQASPREKAAREAPVGRAPVGAAILGRPEPLIHNR
jgi:hypothetical protein